MRAAIVVWLAACGGGGTSSDNDGGNPPDDSSDGPEATACPDVTPDVVDLQIGFATDATHFYFASTSTELARRPVGGGAVEKIADLPGTIAGPIALGDQHVFGVAGGVAFRVAKAGGTPESLGAVAGQVVTVAADGDSLYFATFDNALELRRAATVGGTTTLLADASTDGVEKLASDGSHLYWTPAQNGVVRRIPIAGGTVEEFADSRIQTPARTSTFGLGFAGDDVVWSVFYQSLPDGRLFAQGKTGGERRELSHTGLFTGLEIAGDHLYVALTGDESAIARLPLAGGPREIIGCVADRVFSLEAKDHGIYVTANSEVLRFEP